MAVNEVNVFTSDCMIALESLVFLIYIQFTTVVRRPTYRLLFMPLLLLRLDFYQDLKYPHLPILH